MVWYGMVWFRSAAHLGDFIRLEGRVFDVRLERSDHLGRYIVLVERLCSHKHNRRNPEGISGGIHVVGANSVTRGTVDQMIRTVWSIEQVGWLVIVVHNHSRMTGEEGG